MIYFISNLLLCDDRFHYSVYKDNYLLLSPKRRRKQTSGDDTHRGDTKGPEDRVTEGLVPSWKRERAGAGAKPPSRKWLPGTRQEREGLLPARRRQWQATSSVTGISAEDPCGAPALFSCTLGSLDDGNCRRLLCVICVRRRDTGVQL